MIKRGHVLTVGKVTKNCLICKDSVLRKIYTDNIEERHTGMYIYEYYECDKSGDKCNSICEGRYLRCILCQEIFMPNDEYMHAKWRHVKHFSEEWRFSRPSTRNFDLSKVHMRFYSYITTLLDSFICNNNHLSLIELDSAYNTIDEFIKSANDFGKQGPDILPLIEEHYINSCHKCVFCGQEYDTFPSSDVVYEHIKICEFLIGMRELNHI